MTLESVPLGYVDAEALRTSLGLPRHTWRRRLKRHGIQLYGHPGNEQFLLMRQEDVAKLTTPQPSRLAPHIDREVLA